MTRSASSHLPVYGALLAATLAVAGCKNGGGEAVTVGPDEPAGRWCGGAHSSSSEVWVPLSDDDPFAGR